MTIHQTIHTEQDLIRRFGQHFIERWRLLIALYRKKFQTMSESSIMKAATVAMAFYGAAQEGNSELCLNFEGMLHGEYVERIYLGDSPLALDDMTETLAWDTAALMLEEDDDLPNRAQWAFDALEGHVYMAYNLEASVEGVTGVKPEVKYIDNSVPEITDDVANWLLANAAAKGDIKRVKDICDDLKDNFVARYNPKLYSDMIQAMKKAQPMPVRPELNVYGNLNNVHDNRYYRDDVEDLTDGRA